MKKLSLLGMLTLILSVTFYLLISGGKANQSVRHHSIQPQVSKTKEIFLGARKQSAAISDSLKTPDPCDELSRTLDATDFNVPLDEWIEDLDKGQIDKCDDTQLASRLSTLKRFCLEEIDEQACVTEGIFLRSLLRTRNIEDSDDRLQLADLVLKEFAFGKPNFGKLMKFSDKLMDLNPDQLAFHKLWAMSKVIHALEEEISPTEYADEILSRVDPKIWEDQETIALDLALKSGFEPKSVEQIAREMLQKTNDPRMLEMLGWSLWRQNRRPEAIEQLKMAMKVNPKDEWLQEQYKKITAKGAKEDDFYSRFTLGFDLRDLFQ